MNDMMKDVEAAKRLPTSAQRTAAIGALGPQRAFVGKDADQASVLTLADAHGIVRLKLKVDAAGAAAIEFLDENGRTVDHLPHSKP